MSASNFKETTLLKKAFSVSMEIFEVSKSLKNPEKY